MSPHEMVRWYRAQLAHDRAARDIFVPAAHPRTGRYTRMSDRLAAAELRALYCDGRDWVG
jgi:hypothetical protein